jgi:molybdopterin/thiamine biosynthesis adenylyltransferase
MRVASNRLRRRGRVTVLGAGNIGSHTLELVARMPWIEAITLCDFDTYEAANLSGQSILREWVGRPKAEVQAERIRALRRDVAVRAIRARLEDVPLGLLRAELLLGCLDSKLARMNANEVAWRLNAPYVDAGVNADGFLVRISVYQPGPERPCLECAWDERDYANLEQVRPCAPGAGLAPASGAPACLGSLAGSLQAIQCAHFFGPHPERFAAGRQIVFDAAARRFYDAVLPANPHCRFDHETWRIRKLDAGPDNVTLGEALALGRGRRAAKAKATLRLAGKTFVRNLICGCGYRRPVLRVAGRLHQRHTSCPNCGKPLLAAGLGALAHLDEETLPKHALSRPLSALGMRAGDVFTITRAGRSAHWELKAHPAKSPGSSRSVAAEGPVAGPAAPRRHGMVTSGHYIERR